MSHHGELDLEKLLKEFKVPSTSHRLAVLTEVAEADEPMRARDVYEDLARKVDINRVTVYRILDLLVRKGLIERLSSGDRSFRYGLAPHIHGQPHAHFYCTRCGHMECLNPNLAGVDKTALCNAFKGHIEKIEVRIDGTCENCLAKR